MNPTHLLSSLLNAWNDKLKLASVYIHEINVSWFALFGLEVQFFDRYTCMPWLCFGNSIRHYSTAWCTAQASAKVATKHFDRNDFEAAYTQEAFQGFNELFLLLKSSFPFAGIFGRPIQSRCSRLYARILRYSPKQANPEFFANFLAATTFPSNVSAIHEPFQASIWFRWWSLFPKISLHQGLKCSL